MSPRFYALDDHTRSRGRWRSVYTVRDSEQDDLVVGHFLTLNAARAHARAMNDQAQREAP